MIEVEDDVGFAIRVAAPGEAAEIQALHVASIRALCGPHYAPEVIDGWVAVLRPEGYLPELARREHVGPIHLESTLVLMERA